MRYIFFSFFFLTCCKETNRILPQSTGKGSEVIFVVKDSIWEDSIDSLVQLSFGAPIKGLNQIESIFRSIQVNSRDFKSLFKRHKNIIIIDKGLEDNKQRNKWASDQLIVQLSFGNNPKDLLNRLLDTRLLFIDKEISSLSDKLRKNSQRSIEDSIFNTFGIDCIVPKEYQIIVNDSTFFWANYDPPKSDEIKNILIYSFMPKTSNWKTEVLIKTDSIFSIYLKGHNAESFAVIEYEYPPYFSDKIVRGLWRLNRGFMGGSFLIKTRFIDDRIVVNTGVLFAPQSRKRKYIKEFEAIL